MSAAVTIFLILDILASEIKFLQNVTWFMSWRQETLLVAMKDCLPECVGEPSLFRRQKPDVLLGINLVSIPSFNNITSRSHYWIHKTLEKFQDFFETKQA